MFPVVDVGNEEEVLTRVSAMLLSICGGYLCLHDASVCIDVHSSVLGLESMFILLYVYLRSVLSKSTSLKILLALV